MIPKLLLTTAVALSVAVVSASPTSADPSSFGTLGCTCKPPATVSNGKAPAAATDPVTQGIQSGLGYLPDDPSEF